MPDFRSRLTRDVEAAPKWTDVSQCFELFVAQGPKVLDGPAVKAYFHPDTPFTLLGIEAAKNLELPPFPAMGITEDVVISVRDFPPSQQQVDVTISGADVWILAEVEPNYIQIGANAMSHVFQPFFRVIRKPDGCYDRLLRRTGKRP